MKVQTTQPKPVKQLSLKKQSIRVLSAEQQKAGKYFKGPTANCSNPC